MEPITITILIIGAALIAGGGVHALNKKEKADLRYQNSQLENTNRDLNERLKKEHDHRKRSDLTKMKSVIENCQLKINAALKSGQFEDITFFLLLESIVAELLEISDRLQKSESISESDRILIEAIYEVTKGTSNVIAKESISEKLFIKHHQLVLKQFFSILLKQEHYLQTQLKQGELRLHELRDEINILSVRKDVEGLSESDKILLKTFEGEVMELTGRRPRIEDDLRRLQYFKVTVGKLSIHEQILNLKANPELHKAFNIVLKYLQNNPLSSEDRKFIEAFYLAYQNEVDEYIKQYSGAAA